MGRAAQGVTDKRLGVRALPPLRPPRRPNETAAGSLPSSEGASSRSSTSPLAISIISLVSWAGSRGRLRWSAIVLSQEQPERLFARSIGHRHRFKIYRRLIDWGVSSGTVNLPAPRFGIVGPVLNDHGIVVRLKIYEHAKQYAPSSYQRLVAVNPALFKVAHYPKSDPT